MTAGDSAPMCSVVVITFNEEELIEEVLSRIHHNSGLETLEVLVVDGGSTDRTVEIARRTARVVEAPRGRGNQLKIGFRKTSGDAVLFCHGDTLLPEGYGAAVREALSAPGVAGGSFRPRYRPPHPLLKLLSRALRPPSPYLTFGDQAMFARRSSLKAAGGVPDHPQMEDVALALALAEQGKVVRLEKEVITSSRRFLERGPLRQLALDIRLLWDYHVGGLDEELAAARYQISSRDSQPHLGAVGLMAKAPLPGHAKTRLAASVGEARAADIYEGILRELLAQLGTLAQDVLPVIFTPTAEDQAWFREEYPGRQVRMQVGESLGDRLDHASRVLFELGADRALLIGADVPDLTAGVLIKALEKLAAVDLVLGPSPDGGYYLIGLHEPCREIFQGIPWSSPRVLSETQSRAVKLGLSWVQLESLVDIDTGEDWERFQDKK